MEFQPVTGWQWSWVTFTVGFACRRPLGWLHRRWWRGPRSFQGAQKVKNCNRNRSKNKDHWGDYADDDDEDSISKEPRSMCEILYIILVPIFVLYQPVFRLMSYACGSYVRIWTHVAQQFWVMAANVPTRFLSKHQWMRCVWGVPTLLSLKERDEPSRTGEGCAAGLCFLSGRHGLTIFSVPPPCLRVSILI